MQSVLKNYYDYQKREYYENFIDISVENKNILFLIKTIDIISVTLMPNKFKFERNCLLKMRVKQTEHSSYIGTIHHINMYPSRDQPFFKQSSFNTRNGTNIQ